MAHGYVGNHVIGGIFIKDLFDRLEVQGFMGDRGFWTVYGF